MSSAQSNSLGNYTDILLTYEKEYRLSKARDRQEILDKIVGEIASQGKGKSKQGNVKGLEQVS